jgi:hypothetical protein
MYDMYNKLYSRMNLQIYRFTAAQNLNWTPEDSSPTTLWNSFFVPMYGEGLDGPSMGGYGRAPSLTSDYGFCPHESSYPRHGSTHQCLSSAYSPSISPSALPAMEEASQSRSASPHLSQFNFCPHSQTEVYNGSYTAPKVESPGSMAPNMSGFNLPTFPSIHNFSTGSTSTSH